MIKINKIKTEFPFFALDNPEKSKDPKLGSITSPFVFFIFIIASFLLFLSTIAGKPRTEVLIRV
jgi:hypothetical protein